LLIHMKMEDFSKILHFFVYKWLLGWYIALEVERVLTEKGNEMNEQNNREFAKSLQNLMNLWDSLWAECKNMGMSDEAAEAECRSTFNAMGF
jgi:hypothetical protein